MLKSLLSDRLCRSFNYATVWNAISNSSAKKGTNSTAARKTALFDAAVDVELPRRAATELHYSVRA